VIEPKVTVDSRSFDRAFRDYLKVSQKSLAEICNNKAARVAAAAIRETKRANRGKIESDLGRYVTVQETSKRGKVVNRRRLVLNTRTGHTAPLAELIINKRRGRAGQPGLEGAAMAQAVRKMLASRFRSIGFLASGWLAAIKAILPSLVDRSGIRIDRSVKWRGKPKGDAKPARAGWNPLATVENKVDKGERASRIISEGVQRALDSEAKDMQTYVDRKLRKDADAFTRAH
jgi:hypothetical protein